MPQAKTRNPKSGSALLTALFIMTLVAIVATAMSTKIQLDIYRTKLVLAHDKLYLASQAVTFWAISELNKKNKLTTLNSQGMVSEYPANMKNIANSIILNGELYDLQARFNLNNLADKKVRVGFMNFLQGIMPKASDDEKMKLILAVTDWISDYDLAQGKDNYLSYYTSQKPPYYPSHQLMLSVSELRMVKDVNPSTYSSLEPFVTVLPEATPININTASKEVLISLTSAMNQTQVNELMASRKEKGIKNIREISDLLSKLNIANNQITLESNYFLNVAYASSDNTNLTVYSLFKRNRDRNNKITVNLLRQSFNIF